VPEPVGRGQRYMPGLDGLRAVAVLSVIAYHLNFGWAGGGLLGVGVFFTLSGYLITDLLLGQLAADRLRLSSFWLARARRLLPALFVMLAIIVVWVATIGPGQPPEFARAVVAAALYVANWQLIFQHVSYFASFGPPSPLNHIWSLGVEEQFYIFWPLLLLAGVHFVPERTRVAGLRPRLAAVALLLAGASAVEMALLYKPSLDPSRIYFGTDTRAFELLIGCALAMVWPSRRLRESIKPGARRILDGAGAVGLLAILAMVWRTSEYSSFLYEGGFVLLSFATAAALAALVHPGCRIGELLSVEPLRWIGVRSYGIYLWHVPIIVLTTPAADHGINLGRDALQLAATFVVAALSWRFIEQPIRHGALARAWRAFRAGEWTPVLPLRRRSVAILSGSLATLAIAGVGLAQVPGGHHHHHRTAANSASRSATGGGDPATSFRRGGAATHKHVPVPGTTLGVRTVAAHHLRSSCRAVIDIGDSTSEGLISTDYLPNPAQRIEAQYDDVGVTVQHYGISGARSIVETYEGIPNAYEVAQGWKRLGYHGCWVLALGTNDTADVYVGSNTGRLTRINDMMKLIGNQPVMWVNVKSLLSSGPYSEENMLLWDSALLDACRRYPNMRVFNWASVVQSSWFIDDGIHYNTPGYAARARLIAQALARAFPARGRSSGCLVP
jgi:peptidoglycan/LPS O-acetylase OafA/YrhL